ncbi:OLC1v1020682C1 [Oldenlandia corymbosa var. corymbosa]|uniref:OLC1v1020682C1 n=1 Tax=Oldenlandia corymbosa var. corymbosa TaxID=529605 RepID=A0AAV1EHG6_OLDCO|nr:OLC1v1020682C1 [Oldenlandia corymbosa var. corymbosa]
MDSDSSSSPWIRINPSSRRHPPSRDIYCVGEDDYYEGREEDSRPEYLCPFCAEDFDIVSLCCHIDEEHPVEAKNGFYFSPFCFSLTGNYVPRKRRLRIGGPNAALSVLKKELREGNLPSLLNGFSNSLSSTSQPDSLLSSFMYNPPAVKEPLNSHPLSLPGTRSLPKVYTEDLTERSVQLLQPLSEKDHEERTRRYFLLVNAFGITLECGRTEALRGYEEENDIRVKRYRKQEQFNFRFGLSPIMHFMNLNGGNEQTDMELAISPLN